jgi:hypothetical protein
MWHYGLLVVLRSSRCIGIVRLGTLDVDSPVPTSAAWRSRRHCTRIQAREVGTLIVDWAGRSCVSPELADAVLVAEAAGVVIGFLSLRRNSVDESQPMLSGVNPEGRRQGAYRMLIRQGLEWAQRTYAFYTFHKWFD